MIYDIDGNEVPFAGGGYDINGNYIEGQIIPTGDDLTVMTYNVGWWGGSNREVTTNLIFEKYSIDIMGIQEYASNGIDSKASYLAGKGFTYHYLSDATKAQNQKSVESKYQMSNVTEKTFDIYNTEKRSYQKMYFTLNGKQICFVNTHLDYTPKSTLYAQAAELLNAVKNEQYFILVGDLNTKASSNSSPDYINVIKPFVDLGFHTANFSARWGFLNTWTDGTTAEATNWWQTDHVITSSNIYIKNVIVDNTKLEHPTEYAIDHLPVFAELVVA